MTGLDGEKNMKMTQKEAHRKTITFPPDNKASGMFPQIAEYRRWRWSPNQSANKKKNAN